MPAPQALCWRLRRCAGAHGRCAGADDRGSVGGGAIEGTLRTRHTQSAREAAAPRRALAAALCAYTIAALCYVFVTPLWQAPDEPAHYNYVRYVATDWRLPVLEAGDYPAAYLEELKAAGFPEWLPIDSIRYESHQPPLYYAVAAAWLSPWLGQPLAVQVYALRLLSVALGAALFSLTYCFGRRIWPRSAATAIALALAASLVPMQTAVTAAVNNDTLAAAVLLAAALCSCRLCYPREAVLAERLGAAPGRRLLGLPREPLLVGLVVGLCLVTKMTAYIALPLALLCLLIGWKRAALPPRALARPLVALLLPVVLLGALWGGRNVAVYGSGDPLGQVRHDSVVAGQLRTADLLTSVGPVALLKDAAATTFRSFWGIFGWMGVPMHEQVYALLALACLLSLLGVALAALHHRRWSAALRTSVLLLAAWGLLSTAELGWYNLKFVQHQGRYLFVAMPVWAAILVQGMSQVRLRAPLIGALLVAAAVVAAAAGMAAGDLPGLKIAALLGVAVAIQCWRWAGRRHLWAAHLPPLALLWLLDVAGALYYVRVYL